MNNPATMAWLCGKRAVSLRVGRPFILGILNLTPDSFSDGGKYVQRMDAVRQGIALLDQADGLDIGGESTRPGAEAVSAREERARVIPILKEIRKERPDAFLSLDTYKAEVVKAAMGEAGVEVVNDVGGGRWDPQMWQVVADSGVGYICMHAGGKPQTMQDDPRYGDVVEEVREFFEERLAGLGKTGIAEERVVVDVGIGFGKTVEHNETLLRANWDGLGRPLCWGLSRKSFLQGVQTEKKLKNRDEALDWWNRELGQRKLPMVWRVHEPGRVRSGLAD